MKQPDGHINRKVCQWIEIAEEDYRLAVHGMTLSTGTPFRLVAYHAQQCAEKHIKAWLVYNNVDFPFTHNLGFLLTLCLKHTTWKPELEEAGDLTVYAITTRYPGISERVTEAEAIHAIEIAKKVKDAVLEQLSEKGFKIE